MRCLQCGMPLSPSRSECPRCGAVVPGKSASASSPIKREGRQQAHPAQTMAGWEATQHPWSGTGSEASWEDIHQAPTQEVGPYGGPAAPYFGNVQATPQQTPGMPWAGNEQNIHRQPGRLNASPLYNTTQKSINLFAPRIGFTIAGTCIVTGTLILLLVFILAKSLPQDSVANSNRQTTSSSPVAIAPTPTPAPTSNPSPTPDTAAGNQQYFSGAQLGNEINNNTAQLVTQTTAFQLHQKIFVTFQVHTGNQIGAACLLWHWGNSSQTQFQFPLQGSTGTAYSYMPAEATGTGKVEIYYASTTTCTDKILAQSVDFSVSA